MRIAFITAGAAGMYCGSCMRDNALVAALIRLGHDALLIPTYTPIRTDETDVSQPHVFFGGINVYLEQKFWLFRHTPGFVDWLLNRPRLLRWVSRFASNVDYADLGDLTVSMLRGRSGRQCKELRKLIQSLKTEIRPDVILMTNVLLSGIVPAVKQELSIPVLSTLQGDDIFLEALPIRQREQCLELIRKNDQFTDGYISTSQFYADAMSQYLGVDRKKIAIVYPGIQLKGHHGRPRLRNPDVVPVVGYFARICPEKGFHQAVDAFIHLRQTPTAPRVIFRYAGWLSASHQAYLAEQQAKLEAAGLAADSEYVLCPTHEEKARFLQSLDVLTVPTVYHEPKGLYVLEAWANGVPVVQPRHGSFPELIEATQGGLLVEPGNPVALSNALQRLCEAESTRLQYAQNGHSAVRERFTDVVMAQDTLHVLARYLSQSDIQA
ncbi:MAG: glycosyltransferase family 4 protein [Bacteroidales bacterium]|nr:glycosyltransferase family 4 protein [Bacteroidales bacterium]